MKKNVFGRQFKRDANERKALFKGLMTSLVLQERIETTEQKAKAVKGAVEKLVTKAKIKGIAATPLLLPYLHEDAVKRMIIDIAPRFANRPGGYTRIIRLGKRFGDDATVVILEWVERSQVIKNKNEKVKKENKKTDIVESTVIANKKDNKKEEKKANKKLEKETKKETKRKEKKA